MCVISQEVEHTLDAAKTLTSKRSLKKSREQRKREREREMKIKKEEEKKKKQSSVMQEEEETGRELQEMKKMMKESKDEGGGKTVLVGIRMDADSRELLTWSLVKIAEAGDRVVALHVLPCTTPDSSDVSASCSSLLSLVKAFDAMLAVYDGFCNLKQVDLKMKIARGSSIRKVLVREAISYGVSTLVLGVAKNDHAIGYSSTSIAKYCAKKLPQDCSVFAVSNGKTLFKREALPASQPVADNKARNHPKNRTAESAGQQALTRSYSKLLNARAEKSPQRFSNLKKTNSNCSKIRVDVDKDQNSTIQNTHTMEEQKPLVTESDRDQSLALVPTKKAEPRSSSVSLSFWDSSEVRPGWPLLRKAVLSDRRTASVDGSNISVVQWAMRLPSRFSATSTVHPDHKSLNSDARAASRLDEDSGAIVPMEANSPRPSPLIQEEEKRIPKELEHLQEKYSSVCRLFSYKDLSHMTSDFSPEKLIGKGGSSQVYKGCLSDGKELAVKILKPSEDVMNEFISEIEIITSLHHKNIVSLLGFCFEDENLVLVYDFLSRGSLEDNLHGESSKKNGMGWAERYKVAVGVAEALAYLHGANNVQPVIHRDVKSSNILLSADFEPQLADFGLAKWASSASASQLICNDVAGTFGYLAPEYFMYGKVNEKIDVYAFGVVLLELISGRKPVRSGCPKGQESLVMWAMPILQAGEVKELVDPCLGTSYDQGQLERMMLAATLCIKRSPRSRPRITLVRKLLQGDDDVLRWARLQVGTSEELDGLEDEAVFKNNNIQSHINLVLQDIDDDSLSVSSVEPPTANMSLEDYLQGRWSRSSSFD